MFQIALFFIVIIVLNGSFDSKNRFVSGQTNCKQASINITSPVNYPGVVLYQLDTNPPTGVAFLGTNTATLSLPITTGNVVFNLTMGSQGTVERLVQTPNGYTYESVSVVPVLDSVIANFNGVLQTQAYSATGNVFTFNNFDPTIKTNTLNVAVYQIFTQYGTVTCSQLYSFLIAQPF